MGKDSKSGLRISEVIIAIFIFITMFTSTQLLVSNQYINKEEKIAQEKNESSTKVRVVSSRGGIERNTITHTEKVETEENNYISISEIKISKDMDLTKRCGVSKEDFKKLMKGLKKDTTKFFYNNSDLIYDLCERYELNEIFFCGLIAGESGWNISSSHRSKCNYISMMNNGKLIKYATPEKGLEAAAKLLHTKYLTPGGSCYNGKTLLGVKKRFCPNSKTWVNLIYTCMNQIV